MSERITPDTLIKILGPDRMPYHGGYGRWPEAGVWRYVEGSLIECQRGLHVCTVRQSIEWLGPKLWTVEIAGEHIHGTDKIVARQARLVKPLTRWTERTARLFAADCAEHVLHIYEQANLNDLRPRQAIAAARKYANGTLPDSGLIAASHAANQAAEYEHYSAAWSAAWAVSINENIWAIARSSAWSATQATNRHSGNVTERDWQTERLCQYLNGEDMAS